MQTEKRIEILKIKKQKQIIRVNGFYSFDLTVNIEPLKIKIDILMDTS